MSRSFTACDSVTHEGVTNTWFTPRSFIAPLGEFDLDPCTQSVRPFDTAKRHFCEDQGMDGLAGNWEGRVWLNPPYGKMIGHWLHKMALHGNGVALVFARVETEWAQKALKAASLVNFLQGRISFIRCNGNPSSNAGCASMLLAYGQSNIECVQKMAGVSFRIN